MCGIVAYIGPREAYPVIIKGLKRLEYRGYDSAGVALLNGGLKLYKKKGSSIVDDWYYGEEKPPEISRVNMAFSALIDEGFGLISIEVNCILLEHVS